MWRRQWYRKTYHDKMEYCEKTNKQKLSKEVAIAAYVGWTKNCITDNMSKINCWSKKKKKKKKEKKKKRKVNLYLIVNISSHFLYHLLQSRLRHLSHSFSNCEKKKNEPIKNNKENKNCQKYHSFLDGMKNLQYPLIRLPSRQGLEYPDCIPFWRIRRLQLKKLETSWV